VKSARIRWLAGTEQLARLDQLLAAVQDRLLEPLTQAERRTLVGMLTRLLEHQSSR
jgi:hypothetical protein